MPICRGTTDTSHLAGLAREEAIVPKDRAPVEVVCEIIGVARTHAVAGDLVFVAERYQ